jgi:ferric-dicitrate binding protein FerR (iron transport regulator)
VPTRRHTLTVAGGGLLLAAKPRLTAPLGIGQVTRRTGEAAAIRGPMIVALVPGDPIFVDDILRTGSDSRLLISCADGLQITIGPATELAVRSYLADQPGHPLEVVLGLLQGIARLVGAAMPKGRTIEIDTRTAIASVRSTQWLLESTDRGTGVLSIEGEVTVLALAGGQVVLQPGQGTDVPPGGPPKTPAVWGAARRRDAIARTTI